MKRGGVFDGEPGIYRETLPSMVRSTSLSVIKSGSYAGR